LEVGQTMTQIARLCCLGCISRVESFFMESPIIKRLPMLLNSLSTMRLRSIIISLFKMVHVIQHRSHFVEVFLQSTRNLLYETYSVTNPSWYPTAVSRTRWSTANNSSDNSSNDVTPGYDSRQRTNSSIFNQGDKSRRFHLHLMILKNSSLLRQSV
jgi:hypothetical protein